MTTERANHLKSITKAFFCLLASVALLSILAGAGCGGEELQDLDENLAPQTSVQQPFSGFWHKAAYILTDDDDAGYRASTDALIPKLSAKRYFVTRVRHDAYNTVLNDVRRKKLILSKVLIVANGHGGAGYAVDGVFSDAADWPTHTVGIGQGANREAVSTATLAAMTRKMRSWGKQVVIMDNSCSGGATVKYVEHLFPSDNGVCAIASTGAVTPAAVGWPRYQDVIGNPSFRTYESLGLWASKVLTDGAQGTGGGDPNYRVHQYGYMNGCTKTMLLREAMNYASVNLTSWPLWNRQRHNHVYLNPERYYAGNRTDPGAHDYGPAPDDQAAAQGFEQGTLRDIRNLQGANIVFTFGNSYGSSSAVANQIRELYDTVRGEVADSFQNWQNKFLWSDTMAKFHRVCGQNLAHRVRELLWNPKCSPAIVAVPTTCSASDTAKLRKYHRLACTDPSQVVPAVLADYPVVGNAIKGTLNAQQTTLDKLASVSKFLYDNIEGQLCQARGCRAISID